MNPAIRTAWWIGECRELLESYTGNVMKGVIGAAEIFVYAI